MKGKIIDLIRKEKLITIVRGVQKKDICSLCEALYAGGVRLVEVTFDPTGKISEKETAEVIAEIADKFKSKITVGAGTVLDIKYAKMAVAAGAKYLISPNVDKEVIQYCQKEDIVSLPGAMTPTEIVEAHRAGADMVKVFPSDSLGLAYIKAVRAPLAYIPMLAVGGVDENNVTDYLKAGVCGVGVGSNIVKKIFIQEKRFSEITVLAQKYVKAIENYCKGEI